MILFDRINIYLGVKVDEAPNEVGEKHVMAQVIDNKIVTTKSFAKLELLLA